MKTSFVLPLLLLGAAGQVEITAPVLKTPAMPRWMVFIASHPLGSAKDHEDDYGAGSHREVV
jgi:hypothetical protein